MLASSNAVHRRDWRRLKLVDRSSSRRPRRARRSSAGATLRRGLCCKSESRRRSRAADKSVSVRCLQTTPRARSPFSADVAGDTRTKPPRPPLSIAPLGETRVGAGPAWVTRTPRADHRVPFAVVALHLVPCDFPDVGDLPFDGCLIGGLPVAARQPEQTGAAPPPAVPPDGYLDVIGGGKQTVCAQRGGSPFKTSVGMRSTCSRASP
jgi:hypothetical protein